MKNLKNYILLFAITFLSVQTGSANYKLLLLNNKGSEQFLPASVNSFFNTKDDGTLVCWYSDTNDGSLFFQKIGAAEEKIWSQEIIVDKNLGSGFTADDDYPQIFSDEKGGAVMIYTKSINGKKEICLKKVSGNGSVSIVPVIVSKKTDGYNFSPSAVLTLGKKIAVTWENFSGGDFNIYAQQFDLQGNALWNEGDEVAVCDFPFDQRKPTIASDNENNIFISWLDSRDPESEYSFNLYANVLNKDGKYTNYGSSGKLIIGDQTRNLKSRLQESDNSKPNTTEKDVLSSHNMVSSGNSVIISFERSNHEDDSFIPLVQVDKNLDPIWTRLIDDFYYQTNPLLISDNKGGANIFWNDQRSRGNEIFNLAVSDKGISVWGGENGENISCDIVKNSAVRILPSKKNQSGLCLSHNKILSTWVNSQTKKLYISILNLTGESNNCGNAVVLFNGVSEGEYTSITTQRDKLVVVFRKAKDIYALIKEIGDDSSNTAAENAIMSNFPNPFNPSTKIYFEIPSDGFVRLSVFDIAGREIKSLVSEYKIKGRYSAVFEGSNLPSGVYFYRLESNGIYSTKKMTLIK